MSFAWIAGWFDPRGRLSRRAYARRVVRLLLLSVGLLWLAIAVGSQGGRLFATAAIGGVAMLWFAGLAQAIRRLHDRDRTGWWVSLSFVLPALSAVPVESQADAYPLTVIAYTLATLGVSLWFLVETLGRCGTPGPNAYGPAPSDR